MFRRREPMFSRVVMAASLAWLVPALAAADVIGPPPTDCPDGSDGRACHGNEFCAVDGCISSSECRPGDRCVVRELCIETVACGGGGGGGRMATVTAESCAGCAGRCESHFVCAGSGSPIDAGAPRLDAARPDVGRPDADRLLDAGSGGRDHVMYCGCTVTSRPVGLAPSGALWLAAAALVLATRARRG